MKVSELNQIIENIVSQEVRRTIIKESKQMGKEVYHIKCEGIPIASFATEEEANEQLPAYKAKHKGDLIIEKGVYESHDDMLDKLDEMNDQLEEETDNMENTQMNEKLVGNQTKLDKNHNGKIDGQDFKILKGQKNEEEDAYEGNEFSGQLNKAKEQGDDSFEVDGKTYPVQSNEEEECYECGQSMEEQDEMGDDDNSTYAIWERYSPAAMNEHEPSTFSDEFEYADNVISYVVQEAIANGDVEEEDEDDLTDELKETYGYDLFDIFKSSEGGMDGDDFEDDMEMDESKGTCNECGGMMNEEGMCNECGGQGMYESKKRTIKLTETELTNLITKMVNEAVPGLDTYNKAHKESGKINKQGIDDMMADVNKNHIDVEGNDKPEFPHAIGKGEKVARENTKEQDEETAKNIPGLQNLDYDIEPSEQFKKRLKMAIEGDRLMGNAASTETTNVKPTNGSKLGDSSEDKEGNSIKTPNTAKKIEKQVKDRDKDKKERVLYKKEAVPTNESTMKFSNVLNEEIMKMKSLTGYNKKTQ